MIKVTVLMPCLNEELFLKQALDSLVDDYVREHAEILVIDGMSTDNTVKIAEELGGQGYPVKILENKKTLQCFALNQGIRQAKGDIIIRIDSHSVYPPGYVKRLVDLLETTNADNVGGVMLPKGRNNIQKAVALAMQHPVGVGDAKFHLGNFKGYVDTVYLGTFRKSIFNTIGLYDTNCHTNEDAELNIRILENNGKIYLDSSIEVEYLPRDSFRKLARQYFRYGQGRAYTTRKHKRITSLRQLAAPVLVLGLLAALSLGYWVPHVLAFPVTYVTALFGAALFTGGEKSQNAPLKIRLLLAVAFIVMHIPWGLGFLSFFPKPKKKQH
ncbi:MAG: glycosyltransferase family 2 protein [bacterium]|nr:glycosyltransferase family 2 protein [bacterium]